MSQHRFVSQAGIYEQIARFHIASDTHSPMDDEVVAALKLTRLQARYLIGFAC